MQNLARTGLARLEDFSHFRDMVFLSSSIGGSGTRPKAVSLFFTNVTLAVAVLGTRSLPESQGREKYNVGGNVRAATWVEVPRGDSFVRHPSKL